MALFVVGCSRSRTVVGGDGEPEIEIVYVEVPTTCGEDCGVPILDAGLGPTASDCRESGGGFTQVDGGGA